MLKNFKKKAFYIEATILLFNESKKTEKKVVNYISFFYSDSLYKLNSKKKMYRHVTKYIVNITFFF